MEPRIEEKEKIKAIVKTIIALMIIVPIMFRSYMRNVVNDPNRIKARVVKELEKKYGEKFYITGRFPRGENALMYIIKPERLMNKKGDAHYLIGATVDAIPVKLMGYVQYYKIGKEVKDTYEHFLISEKFDRAIEKEVEKVFKTKNYIVSLKTGLFPKEVDRNTSEVDLIKAIREKTLSLQGGIYIFGRVENDRDKERYRKQVFEFIQFLKANGMFRYTTLDIEVLDERILSKGLNENEEDKAKLRSFENYYRQRERKAIYDKYTESYKETSEEYKQEIISKVRKSNVLADLYRTSLIYFYLNSPEYIKKAVWNKPPKIKEYDKIGDIEFFGPFRDKKIEDDGRLGRW